MRKQSTYASWHLFVCAPVCVCVCACEGGREREREGGCVSMCVCVWDKCERLCLVRVRVHVCVAGILSMAFFKSKLDDTLKKKSSQAP